MTLLPDPWWPTALLAAALLADALMSLRPPAFIRDCLDGVGFPREWWWTLIVIKALAAGGLVVGIWVPGIAIAANGGVIAYFLCAAAAHIRARFLGQAFWMNCLGMLALSAAVPALSLTL
ncbi:DoxX family protein [Nocardiopsis sp. RSe5-2]|uniref:DoxX family protein n=1 Tax=Nocardiopsis endophytica TaxID=3018445 RepID=A0ABT4U3N8_9ACTN|nr:DoxX family protein [Nocardiopsis endophytica]MDA2811582.1 DoxX family protein [Nocardiopsis endophytica]